MIRIAFVIPSMLYGGAEQHVALLCKYLDRKKYSPVVYCVSKEGPFADKVRELGIPVKLLASGRVQSLKRWLLKLLKTSEGNNLTIKQYTNERIYLSKASRLRGLLGVISSIITEFVAWIDLTLRLRRDDIDIVSAHWGSGRCALIAAALAGLPSVYTEHAIVDSLNYSRLQIQILRRLVRLASKVIAVSEQTKLSVINNLGIPPNRIRVIGHAVDFGDWNSNTTNPGNYSIEYRIGTIGNLVSAKGHFYMISSMPKLIKSYPKIKYIVAGDGPMKRFLEEEVSKLNVSEAVQFIGCYRNEDLPRLLADWDMVVLPSISEALGIVALEAMACGKPVIASSVGGLAEIIKDNETGLLVPPCDPDALVYAIRRLLNDGTLRQNMAHAAWKHSHNFTPEHVVIETVHVYESLLEKVNFK